MTTPPDAVFPDEAELREFGIKKHEYALYLKSRREGKEHLLSISLTNRLRLLGAALTKQAANYRSELSHSTPEIANLRQGGSALSSVRALEIREAEREERRTAQQFAELDNQLASNPSNITLRSELGRVESEWRSAVQRLAELRRESLTDGRTPTSDDRQEKPDTAITAGSQESARIQLPDPDLAANQLGDRVGRVWMYICQIVQDELGPESPNLLGRARWYYRAITGSSPTAAWPFVPSGFYDAQISVAAAIARRRYLEGQMWPAKPIIDETDGLVNPSGNETTDLTQHVGRSESIPCSKPSKDDQDNAFRPIYGRVETDADLKIRSHKDVEYWRPLQGQELEMEVGQLYCNLGRDVRVTYPEADDGVDLVVSSASGIAIIQCKGEQKRIGQPAVMQLIGARQDQQAEQAVLVSTSGFTKQAEHTANRNDIELVGPLQLTELGDKAELHLLVNGGQPGTLTIDDSPRCMERDCRSEMYRVRVTPQGEWWECSQNDCSGQRWTRRSN